MLDEHGQQDKERGVSGTGRSFRGKVRNKEPYFVAFSLLYLAVGVGAVWFIRSIVGVRGDATLVAFLIVPLALYLTLSGRVSEITAGGLAVKLRQAGHERAAQPWTEAHADADHGLTFDLRHYWPVKTDPNRPQVATLTLGGALEVTEAGACLLEECRGRASRPGRPPPRQAQERGRLPDIPVRGRSARERESRRSVH